METCIPSPHISHFGFVKRSHFKKGLPPPVHRAVIMPVALNSLRDLLSCIFGVKNLIIKY